MGILEYSSGDVYDGQWEKDTRHGKELLTAFFSIS